MPLPLASNSVQTSSGSRARPRSGWDRFDEAAAHLAEACKGGWSTTPANIVHMVRELDAW
jgi:hypothetical protein